MDHREESPMEDLLLPGHAACAGCSAPTAVKLTLEVLGRRTVVVVPACCMAVIQGLYPKTCFSVPLVNIAFEAAAACASGIEAALKRKGERANVLVVAGDGGTFDIGIQSLSGMIERGHKVIYMCYDNEAYMNTGIQRSGATPWGAWTTTTPVGKRREFKKEPKKDLAGIIAAHNPSYLATATIAFPLDLKRKVEKARDSEGPAFIHVLAPCPTGWRYPPEKTFEISKLAVETGIFPLYEFKNGKFRITYKPKERKPVEEYLRLQGRFRHLTKEEIEKIQKMVDETWERIESETRTEI